MSKSNNLKDFVKDLADAIRDKTNTTELINPQDFSNKIKDEMLSDIESESKGIYFTPQPQVISTDTSGGTAYISTHPCLGYVTEETEDSLDNFSDLGVVTRLTDLKGNDRIFKRWSLAEINTRWLRNGCKRTTSDGGTYNLTEPIGLAVKANGMGWKLLGFPYFKDDSVMTPTPYYDIMGETAISHANNLRHSHYFYSGSPFYNSTANGTDSETEITDNVDAAGIVGKMLSSSWSVVSGSDSDHLKFYTANTDRYFEFEKPKSTTCYVGSEDEWQKTEYLWQFSEWYRHSFAIYSGIDTSSLTNNGNVSVLILNSSGDQPAVGEDMYFWLSDGNTKINTNLLAKYNINAQHGTTGGSSYSPLRSTVRDYIYQSQIRNGINMNDTGVNSESKNILTPGSKGAEAILVDDKWMIATPIVTRAKDISSWDYNMVDCPAVAWARNICGLALVGDLLGMTYYFNRTATSSSPKTTSLYYAMISYLASYEGWFSATYGVRHRMVYYTSGYGSNYLWCAARYGASAAWYCNAAAGYVGPAVPSYGYRALVSSALN